MSLDAKSPRPPELEVRFDKDKNAYLIVGTATQEVFAVMQGADHPDAKKNADALVEVWNQKGSA